MAGEPLYDDGLVVLDAEGVTLRRYYFPTGAPKRIPYGRIRHVDAWPNTWATGKGRIWGTAHPGYWMPLDGHRFGKPTVVALDVGARVKPAFTPADPDRLLAALRDRVS